MSLTKQQYNAFSEEWRDTIDSLESRGHKVEWKVVAEGGYLLITEDRTAVHVWTYRGKWYILALAGPIVRNMCEDALDDTSAIVKLEELLDAALDWAYGHGGGAA